MAAAKGNQYGAKERRWAGMLQRVLARPDAGGDRLERIALKLLECAENGEPWAITELANRLDGKPKQQVEISERPAMVDYADMTDDELLAIIAAGKRKAKTNGAATQH